MYSFIPISSYSIENLHEDTLLYHLFLDSLKVYSTLRQVNKYLYNLSQQVKIKNLLKPVLTYNKNNNKEEYSVFKGTEIKYVIYRKWYRDGQLSKECHYKEGKLEGLTRKLYHDGQLSKECNYKEGKLEGLSRKWYDNGSLHVECHYKEDKLDESLYEFQMNHYM